MKVEIELNNILAPLIQEIKKVATYNAKREIYPKKIKGNTLASLLLNITPNTLKQRVYKGFYQEGYHFVKKSDRIYLWDRDALLED